MSTDSDGTVSSQPPLSNVDVLLVDDDEQWGRVTARLLESAEEAFDIKLAHSLAEGREQFAALDPGCVICDYQLGDGTGLALLETVRETDVDRPFILVTGRGDESVASDAIGRGVTDYIPKANDDTDATLLANRVRNAVVSSQARRRLDRERRGKAATLDLLASTTNMADLSSEFCRVLVEDHGYAGVWIGAVTEETDRGIAPQAVERCEAYLDAITDSGLVRTACGDPVVLAAERNERVVISPATSEESTVTDHGGEWAAAARDHGFGTAAGIPITRDGLRVGVLGVYSSPRGSPLEATQWQLLEEYADIIGHAHRTAELKRSLFADRSTRLDIEITDTTAPLAALTDQLPPAATVTVLSTITRDDGSTLYLMKVSDIDHDRLRGIIASCEPLDLETVSEIDDGVRCELVTTVRTPVDVAASHGAGVNRTIATDGTVTVSVSVADHGAVSTVATALRAEYDDVTLTTLWNNHTRESDTMTDDPIAALTDKQRDVLSHAYFDGYFDQPRGVSATELAAKFNLARPTVTQHLRSAQRKVFGRLFDD